MTEIQTGSEFKSPPATPTGDFKQGARVLRDDDLQNIYAALTKGDGGLARRRDLGEMHKRLVAMVTTLNQGLGDAQIAKAAADRAELGQRLDQMERAVNSMDGALRIELEPILRTIVTDAVSANNTPRNRQPVSVFLSLVVFIAGIALGAIYAPEIKDISNEVLAASTSTFKNSDAESSLIGGIGPSANLMK